MKIVKWGQATVGQSQNQATKGIGTGVLLVMKQIIKNQEVSGHPMPLSYYINQGIGSRASFHRWEKLGLEVLRVGRCVFIEPAALTRFMHEQSKAAK